MYVCVLSLASADMSLAIAVPVQSSYGCLYCNAADPYSSQLQTIQA
jgi:hypothetical protein